MVPITIQCGCGQRFSFEVEPVGSRIPSPVACPSCGADGTEAANQILAQSMAEQSATVPGRTPPLRIALAPRPPSAGTGAAGRTPLTQLPGQVSRTQAKIEARAKMLWGDSPQAVLVYLASQGFDREEAAALAEELSQERAATIRGKGLMYLIGGITLICVPIVTLLIFLALGYILVKTFTITVLAGFWGVWMVFKGAGMLMAPKSAEGDVSDQ
jgi:hypothetical protein